jgi:hypothetical protein
VRENKNFSSSFLVKESVDTLRYLGSHTIDWLLVYCRLQYCNITIQLQKISATNTNINEFYRLAQKQVELEFRIRNLKALKNDSFCKPPLSMCRRVDWFYLGERVVCFVPESSDEVFVKGEVYNDCGVLYDGQRVYSVVYDINIATNYFLSGYGALYSVSDPFILKNWEYEYIKNHLDFAHIWIKYGVHSRYSFGEAVCFSNAL